MNTQPSTKAARRPVALSRLAGVMAVACLVMMLSLVLPTPARTQSQAEQPNSPTIVGGREAEPGEWPWQVALISAGGHPYHDQYCGGTLISPLWVLTAAHCVDGSLPDSIQVLAGIHNLLDADPGFLRLDVSRIIVHPNYAQATRYDSDIALLELSAPATFRPGTATQLPIDRVFPAAAGTGSLAGVEATVTGWGDRLPGANDFPAELHEVEVPIVTNSACGAAYPGSITANMICAGLPQGGRDSCQGDSGGPLVVFNNERSQWELAGIVSWGQGCALPGLPGVYTRVSRFAQWVAAESGIAQADFFLGLTPAEVHACAGTTVAATVNLTAGGGFNEPVALSLAGLPTGATATLQPSSLVPPGSSALIIGTSGVAGGVYDLLVRGTSGGVIHGVTLTLAIETSTPDAPQLLGPPANSLGHTVAPHFVWKPAPGANRYRLEVATGPEFLTIVHSADVATAAYRLEEWLEPETTYYWRVRAENRCGASDYSTVYRLVTGRPYCQEPGLLIPDDNERGITDSMTATGGPIADLDVFLRINHTYIGDLRVTLAHAPSGVNLLLFNKINCMGDDVAALFDDEGNVSIDNACIPDSPVTPAVSGYPVPTQLLATFDGRWLAGEWQLSVADWAPQDIGTLVEWCLMPSLATHACSTISDVPAVECAALEAVFTAGDGWLWTENAGWLDDQQACRWHGVTCAGGHVTGLQLPGNGLSGQLPEAIGNLSRLATLDLSGNSALVGQLPDGLMALPLVRFWFDDTALCVPAHAAFAGWLSGIDDLMTSGRTCARSFVPLTKR